MLLIPSIAASVGMSAPPIQVVAEVTREISPQRLRADVDRLAAFGTRHTFSETESEIRGIGAARRWVKGQFDAAAAASGRTGDDAISVWFDSHHIEPDGRRILDPVDVVNVVCEIPGTMPGARQRRYYVMGHLDSRASGAHDATSDAPGANDDASGVALCLELARALSRQRLDSTVVLMATSGEEQGLYGARGHARLASERGWVIPAVLSNDIVGDPTGPRDAEGHPRSAPDLVRVFSEGIPQGLGTDRARQIWSLASEQDSPSRQLARFIADVAAEHDLRVEPKLIFRPDRFLRGGDHTPFNELGFPSVRFTEVYETYDRQHQDVRVEDGRQFGDLPEYVDEQYLAGVARLNATAIVHLANAPSTPANARIITAELSNDTTLRWDASPEPDVAGYEVVWRPTTSAMWEFTRDVGDVLEATIDLSKDDVFFGVRAYDREGYRSPVVFPTAAQR